MNNALLVGNQMNNNLPGGEDCGCMAVRPM